MSVSGSGERHQCLETWHRFKVSWALSPAIQRKRALLRAVLAAIPKNWVRAKGLLQELHRCLDLGQVAAFVAISRV